MMYAVQSNLCMTEGVLAEDGFTTHQAVLFGSAKLKLYKRRGDAQRVCNRRNGAKVIYHVWELSDEEAAWHQSKPEWKWDE